MQITFPHQIEYATKVNLTLSDIAHAIMSHEELIKPVAAILEDVVPGLEVSKIEIRLTRAENGSLREEFLVSLWVAFQEDLVTGVTDVVRALTGVDVPDDYDALVTLLVLIIALGGAGYLVRRVFPRREPSCITGNYNTYINIAAKTLQLDPAALQGAVDRAVPWQEKRSLARAVVDFFRPAKVAAQPGARTVLPDRTAWMAW